MSEVRPGLRYSEADKELLAILFPNEEALILLRRVLLGMELTKDEIAHAKMWSTANTIDLVRRAVMPVFTGTQALGAGYDHLHGIEKSRVALDPMELDKYHRFARCIKRVNKSVDRLSALDTKVKSPKYLTAKILASKVIPSAQEMADDMTVIGMIDGGLVDILNLTRVKVETPEDKALRLRKDSTR